MSADINTWKLKRSTTTLAQILTCLPGIDQTKIVSKALDGTIYIQTIGSGSKFADISIFVTKDEMPA